MSSTRLKVSDLLIQTGKKDRLELTIDNFPRMDDIRDMTVPITAIVNLQSFYQGIIVVFEDVKTTLALVSDISGRPFDYSVHVPSYEVKFLADISGNEHNLNDSIFVLDLQHGSIDIADPLEQCIRLCLPIQCLAPGEFVDADDEWII